MRHPVSSWVRRFAPLVPAGEVLDLACGDGRHARHFASLGYPVLAVDIDSAALATLVDVPGISCMEADLEDGSAFPFAPGRFTGIVVTNYLHRPLMKALVESLAPDGVLIYETFAKGNEAYGKPSNPAFLLAPGELLTLANDHKLQVLAYEDGLLGRPAFVQRLCATGPGYARENSKLE